MRFSILSAIVVAALSLAACGQNEAAAPVSAAATAQYDKAAGLMPPFAPIFPGASVQSSIGSGTGPDAAGNVSFSTQRSAEDVIAFYRDKAMAAGLEEMPDIADTGTLVFSAVRPSDAMGIRVLASGSTGGTNVQVLWSHQSDEDEE